MNAELIAALLRFRPVYELVAPLCHNPRPTVREYVDLAVARGVITPEESWGILGPGHIGAGVGVDLVYRMSAQFLTDASRH